MSKATITRCDSCGREVVDGKGARVRTVYGDKRRGVKIADVCDECVGVVPGVPVKQREARQLQSA